MILTTVLPAYGCEEFANAFVSSESKIVSPQFEEFEDGELGSRLDVDSIRDRRVLVVADSSSSQSILNAYDLACAAQQYGAVHVGILLLSHIDTSKPLAGADLAFDQLMGHIFSSVPRAPFGNTFFSFDVLRRELSHQSLRPSPDSSMARASRETLQKLVSVSLGAARTLRTQEQSNAPWLVTPATHAGLTFSIVDDAAARIRTEPLVLSIRSYGYLRDRVAKLSGYKVGELEYEATSTGIRMPFAGADVLGREVLIIAGSPSDDDYLEASALICSCVEQGASHVTVAIPYMGCARMDRAVEIGDVVTAKSRARMLSYLPQAPFLNTFIFFDLHTFGVQQYFEGPSRRSHYYLEKVMNEAIAAELGGKLDFVATPDIGHAKWTRSYARAHGLEEVVIDKVRLSGKVTTDFRILVGDGNIAGKSGMLHDDLTCTCGTAIGAGRECRKKGPKIMFLGLSHGAFSPGAVQKLRESEIFTRAIVSNSHPTAHAACQEFPDLLREVCIAPVILEAFTLGTTRA